MLSPITDPVIVFAVVTMLILTTPLLLERYRIPGAIGMLLAGAILGPNALGILARDQSIVLLGTVGLLYIMFAAALEIDLIVLKRSKLHSIVFGVLTFALPQGLGALMAYYILGFDWPAAILLASLFASHTLLTYPIVSRLGLAKNQAVTTTLGGTIITDTAALLVLAIIARMTEKGEIDDVFWFQLGLSMSLYVSVILIGLPRLARWFFRNVRPDGPAEFIFVLASVFVAASLSHLAGIEPIVGAFLAGLALNRLIPHDGPLMNRVQFTGEALFIPFFLLSIGMLLDVRVFFSGFRSWAVSIGMLGSVLATKWMAARLAGLVFRYNRDEIQVMFGLSVPQAAATLAAVMVGYRIGLFDDAVVNGAIVMMIGTCVYAPLVVDRHGRNLAMLQEDQRPDEDTPPQRILVSMSNAETAVPLLDLAMLVRDNTQAQPIYPLTVVHEDSRASENVVYAEKMLARAVMKLTAADVPTRAVTRIDINTAAAIMRARQELRISHVIVGWAGKVSAQNRLFGTVLEKLLDDPEPELLVARLMHPLNTMTRILLAIPPRAEREPGFLAVSSTAKMIAAKLSCPVVILGEKQAEKVIKRQLSAAKPAAEFKIEAIESWEGLQQALADRITSNDLLMLYAPREGSLGWKAALDRIPRQIAERFPDANFVVSYPPEPAAATMTVAGKAAEVSRLAGLVSPERVMVHAEDASLQVVLQKLLEKASPGLHLYYPLPDSIIHGLLTSAVQVTPGVFVVHGDYGALEDPAVLICSSAGVFEQPASVKGARLVFVVLNPSRLDYARERLDVLADIAHSIRSSEAVGRAIAAVNAEELMGALGITGTAETPSGSGRQLPPATAS